MYGHDRTFPLVITGTIRKGNYFGRCFNFFFLAVGFLVDAFFCLGQQSGYFLVERGGDGRDSEGNVNSLLAGLFQFEYDSSISC